MMGPDDPEPVEWIQRDSQSPVLLLCEHAGQAIPTGLNGLGLPKSAIDLHIGWDIGARQLAQAVAERLDAPLILQNYSRLVVDCNRPPGSDGFIPEVSDEVIVPRNQGLDAAERMARQRLIFDPLNKAIRDGFERVPRRAAFSIHTFTRQMQLGERREWDAGFLCRHDLEAAQMLLESIGSEQPGLALAVNEPYQIEEFGDWFIPEHAEKRGVRHTLIEVCNDQVRTEAQVSLWADLLATAIRKILAATP